MRLALLLCSAVVSARAQNVATIDASASEPSPAPVVAQLGTGTNPDGQVIGVNSQFLTFDGKPWMPVMGEFHFSRYPEADWEEEILKMKAAGVEIISTYVIWIHHEQIEGTFDWKGQRDLRRFVKLCAAHGMYVYPRIGPWAHAEVRNGGLPDWVLRNGPTRENDPVYLSEVQSFYMQIAMQLQGFLWKDGGPVIGLQIENEYRSRGTDKGDEHIRTLKHMAVAVGLDVPLYTVTGWDGAAIPLDTTLPVFGGYPDSPWNGSSGALPPNEVYAFRFGNRSAGSMGAIGSSGQSGADVYRGTPFLTAEVGDGIEDTYFRRPVLSNADVEAIVPVMLGSGANLLGYYMFHGGRNPDAEPAAPGDRITLQESQRTGYPTDLPIRSYDFQAPLGEFGQERATLRQLKLVHYFLADFGAELAPMLPHAPALVPRGPADLSVVRVSARTKGDSGFVFFNNHVRGMQDLPRPGFQVQLKLPASSIRIPQQPMTLPAGAFGIWPVNLQLPGTTLRYATAQLFKRVEIGGKVYLFFFSIPGIDAELAFDEGTKAHAELGQPALVSTGKLLHIRCRNGVVTAIALSEKIHLVIMPESQAEDIWRVHHESELVQTSSSFFSDGEAITLDSTATPSFRIGLFGPHGAPSSPDIELKRQASSELFDWYTATVPSASLQASVTPVRQAGIRPSSSLGPAVSWRANRLPMAPEDAEFDRFAATWKLQTPPIPASLHLSDAFLTVHYQGDVARLTRDGSLVEDNFWNGVPWQIGLREIESSWPTGARTYQLQILPLRKNAGLVIDNAGKLDFDSDGQAISLEKVTMVPQYRIQLQVPGLPK